MLKQFVILDFTIVVGAINAVKKQNALQNKMKLATNVFVCLHLKAVIKIAIKNAFKHSSWLKSNKKLVK